MSRQHQPTMQSAQQGEALRALHAEYYVSEDVFAEERERLFFKSWQYACHISELDQPGDYVTTDILGQNVLVLRDQTGDIRAYYNVCPHRGHKLAEGAGQKGVIVCPYHHWSFSLDGSLRSMRQMKTIAWPRVIVASGEKTGLPVSS